MLAWPDFLDLASALARLRCSSMAGEALTVDGESVLLRHLEGEVDREAVGVVPPESLVAGQRRATPDALVLDTAVSRIVVPEASVRRNASSSAYAILLIRSNPDSSSGSDCFIRSIEMGSRCGRAGSS